MIKRVLLRCLLWLIERDLQKVPKFALTEEQRRGLLAQLWENGAFRNYVSDRNQQLIYSIAGLPGAKLETTEKLLELRGQRIELLEFAAKAKLCSETLRKKK